MWKRHLAEDRGWDSRHGIGVAMPQKDVIKRGIDEFNVNANILPTRVIGKLWNRPMGWEA